MASGNLESSELIREIIDEAKRIEEDALYDHVGHTIEARKSDTLHYWLGIPATLLAAFSGITSIATASVQSDAGYWASVIAGVLSFGVAALAGLNSFLDPKGRAADHYRSANAYAAIRNSARYFYNIECKKNKSVEDLDADLVSLRKQLEDLDIETPIIPGPRMEKAAELIKAKKFEYDVDMLNEKQGKVR